MTKRQSLPLAQKKLISLLFIVIITGGGTAYAEILDCEIGDTSKGYWQMIGAHAQEECIIPGAPDPDSKFLHDNTNSAFRIEGRYKVETVLTSPTTVWLDTPGECPSNSCISGFREWYCNKYNTYNDPHYSYKMVNSLCVQNNNGNGNKRYLCTTDTNHVTLWEWKCNAQQAEQAKNSSNQGPLPCIQRQ